MVRLGRALNECKSKTEADTVAEVIVSQVWLRDAPCCAYNTCVCSSQLL